MEYWRGSLNIDLNGNTSKTMISISICIGKTCSIFFCTITREARALYIGILPIWKKTYVANLHWRYIYFFYIWSIRMKESNDGFLFFLNVSGVNPTTVFLVIISKCGERVGGFIYKLTLFKSDSFIKF